MPIERQTSRRITLVTEAGLKALEFQLLKAREAYETAQKIEDVNERRRQAAMPLRDMRYFAARVRTAQVITHPSSTDTVAFGNTVTFRRDDGRVQRYPPPFHGYQESPFIRARPNWRCCISTLGPFHP